MPETDAKEVKEILEVVSEKIPALIENLTDILYGEKSSAKYGKAVASFYKTLVESGMTNEQAFELTQQYMSSLNLAGMIGKAIGEGKHGHDDVDIDIGDEIGKEIEIRVKKKLEEKLRDEE